MSTLGNMYRMLRGSPVMFLGGAILITGSSVFFMKNVYGPYRARNRRSEAEYVADYLFQREQGSRGVDFQNDKEF